MRSAFGLSPFNDWSSSHPTIDLLKRSRQLVGSTIRVSDGGGWGARSNAELKAAGVLDADGWPTYIPADLDMIETVWVWSDPRVAHGRDGRYVMTWTGQGTLRLSSSCKIVSQEEGRMVFDFKGPAKLRLQIRATDQADHIRDVRIFREEHELLHDAGQIWTPEFLAHLAGAETLRFMDWMNTNDSRVTSWADRTKPSSQTWQPWGPYSTGVPVEAMVNLCNTLGAAPWFNLPHLAGDDYVAGFASIVRDQLDPGLRATIECSNEVWSPGFDQYHDLKKLSKAQWGWTGQEFLHVQNMHLKIATTQALRIDQIFGTEALARVRHVLGTQTANPWVAKQKIATDLWRQYEPTEWVDPSTVFDALGCTSYFGGRVLGDLGIRDTLALAIADPDIDAEAWLHQRLLDPAFPSSIPGTLNALAGNAKVARDEDMEILLYEGGPHAHQQYKIPTVAADISSFMAGFARSPYMADLYWALWYGSKDIIDGPFMQFTEAGPSSKYGSWGIVEYLGDTTPRWEMLQALAAADAAGTIAPRPAVPNTTPQVVVTSPIVNDPTDPVPAEPDAPDGADDDPADAPDPDTEDPGDVVTPGDDPDDETLPDPWDEDEETPGEDPGEDDQDADWPDPDDATEEEVIAALTHQVTTLTGVLIDVKTTIEAGLQQAAQNAS